MGGSSGWGGGGGVCRMKHHRRMELKVGQKQYTSVIKEVKRGGRKSRKLVRQRKWKKEKKNKLFHLN